MTQNDSIKHRYQPQNTKKCVDTFLGVMKEYHQKSSKFFRFISLTIKKFPFKYHLFRCRKKTLIRRNILFFSALLCVIQGDKKIIYKTRMTTSIKAKL